MRAPSTSRRKKCYGYADRGAGSIGHPVLRTGPEQSTAFFSEVRFPEKLAPEGSGLSAAMRPAYLTSKCSLPRSAIVFRLDGMHCRALLILLPGRAPGSHIHSRRLGARFPLPVRVPLG